MYAFFAIMHPLMLALMWAVIAIVISTFLSAAWYKFRNYRINKQVRAHQKATEAIRKSCKHDNPVRVRK